MKPLYRIFVGCIFAFLASATVFAGTLDKKAWEDFRRLHHYSYQGVAIQQHGDSTAIIVSEPPESVSYEDINELFTKYGAMANIYTHKTGYDGWFKDIGATFAFDSKQAFDDFSTHLFRLLYSSDYKPYYINLARATPQVCFSPENINLSVSAAELEKWFITDNMLFNTKSGPKSLKAIISGDPIPEEKVLFSSEPGFVVWILPGKSLFELPDKFNFWKADFRRFALDSDLILGAIGRIGGRVAVIGRERIVPVSVLPPLLAPMVEMLATTSNPSLAQSYERHAVFAGKTAKGQDVAPIYLSDELRNTEYGNLLNVTDQMLKSWCENGRIEYMDFPYPKPVEWAFNKGVLKDLGQETLTYNWNTAGAGYAIECDDKLNIYALNRTGSLPVSLIPAGMEGKATDEVIEAEELAYDFFSGLSNTELVRVVQYASLYQIFMHYFTDENILIRNILPKKPSYKEIYQKEATGRLGKYVEALLRYSVYPSDAESENLYRHGRERYLRRVLSRTAKAMFDSLAKTEPEFRHYKSLRSNVEKNYDEAKIRSGALATYDALVKEHAAKVAAFITEKKIKSADYKRLAELIVNPRSAGEKYKKELAEFNASWNAENPRFPVLLSNLENTCASYDEAVKQYNKKVDSLKNGKLNSSAIALYIERGRIENLGKTIQNQFNDIERINKKKEEDFASRFEPLLELLAWCPDDEALMSVGALNWLLTPHNGFDEPFGEFYAVNFRNDHGRWIKTPSIVCSYNTTGYGGHNLDARIADIKTVKGIKKGFARVSTDNSGVRKISVAATDRKRVTPSLLRKIERKAIEGDVALPAPKNLRTPDEILVARRKTDKRGFDPEAETDFAVASPEVANSGTPTVTVDDYLDRLASAIATSGVSPVKSIRFSNHSAIEVRAMADGLQESILAKTEHTNTCLSDFDINAIEVRTLSDGTVEMSLPSKHEEILGDVIKGSVIHIKAPAQQAETVKDALRKVMAKPQQTIDNDFKWKRQLRLELDNVPDLNFDDIVTDLEHIYSVIFIIRDNHESYGIFRNIAA